VIVKAECLNKFLKAICHPMWLGYNGPAMLLRRLVRPIKDENWDNGHLKKCSQVVKEGIKLRIFSYLGMARMEECCLAFMHPDTA